MCKDISFVVPSFVFTLFVEPYSVRGLHADTLNTTAVRLNWTRPLEHKDAYTYRVETSSCGFHNKTFKEEIAVISGLIPGTNCSFCCFVRAEDGTEGASSCTSQYTGKSLISHFYFFLSNLNITDDLFAGSLPLYQSPSQCSPVSPMRAPTVQSWCHGRLPLGMWINMCFSLTVLTAILSKCS